MGSAARARCDRCLRAIPQSDVVVVMVLCGWALGFRARSLVIYAAVVAAAFHLRVVFGEEPWLARQYGNEWIRYKARVPRWLGIPV